MKALAPSQRRAGEYRCVSAGRPACACSGECCMSTGKKALIEGWSEGFDSISVTEQL